MTLELRFKREFANGVEFWTSQDGTLMGVAVAFSQSSTAILRDRILAVNPTRAFKPSRVKVRYAFREWAEREYWFHRGDKGKVWRIGTQRTPFKVYWYELEQPV